MQKGKERNRKIVMGGKVKTQEMHQAVGRGRTHIPPIEGEGKKTNKTKEKQANQTAWARLRMKKTRSPLTNPVSMNQKMKEKKAWDPN